MRGWGVQIGGRGDTPKKLKIVPHLGIYLRNNIGGISKIKAKSDEWLIFYSKLLLRYYRPYRHKRYHTELDFRQKFIKRYYEDFWEDFGRYRKYYKKHYLNIIPAPAIVEQWNKWAWKHKTKRNLKSLHETCTVKSGSVIQLRYLATNYISRKVSIITNNKQWLSCYGSGSCCEIT